jgi:hypothetical protein
MADFRTKLIRIRANLFEGKSEYPLEQNEIYFCILQENNRYGRQCVSI